MAARGGEWKGDATGAPAGPREIPTWEGHDTLVSREVFEVGPNGRKGRLDDLPRLIRARCEGVHGTKCGLKAAVADEDDDAVETIMNERFYNRPEMYYSPDKLIRSYGVPAPTPAFVYNAVGKKPSADKGCHRGRYRRFHRCALQSPVSRPEMARRDAQLLADDPEALNKFVEGDMTVFSSTQFNQLGGISALSQFDSRDDVFEALRQSLLVRQSLVAHNL
jgi:hypothetical protein